MNVLVDFYIMARIGTGKIQYSNFYGNTYLTKSYQDFIDIPGSETNMLPGSCDTDCLLHVCLWCISDKLTSRASTNARW